MKGKYTMCGRYACIETAAIAERFEADNHLPYLKSRYNATPSQELPVIVRQSPNHLALMRWGFIPSWAKVSSISGSMINARAETLTEKAAFRKAFHSQRCIVPASGFFEWKSTEKGKIPHYIHLKQAKMFAFAGIFDIWHDAKGNEVKTYAIVTTEPNELMVSIHNRMPAILHQEDESLWLDKEMRDVPALVALLRPYPAEEMEAYPVSVYVNNPANDNPEVVQPL